MRRMKQGSKTCSSRKKNALIEDLQANLDRAKTVNDALDMVNRKLGAQIAIYEARVIKARKEA